MIGRQAGKLMDFQSTPVTRVASLVRSFIAPQRKLPSFISVVVEFRQLSLLPPVSFPIVLTDTSEICCNVESEADELAWAGVVEEEGSVSSLFVIVVGGLLPAG